MSDYQFPTSYEAPGVATPRSFGEIPSLWFKVHQMTEEFFAQEAQHTSAGNTLIGVIIYTLVGALLSAIYMALYSASTFSDLASQLGDGGGVGIVGILVASLCFSVIAIPIGFYIGVALIHLGAVVLGGKGSYNTLAYLTSLFLVPLGTVMSLANLIPCVGALIALAVSIYMIILYVRAMKVTYELTTGKAVLAYFIFPITFAILFGCCCVLLLALSGPAIGNVFSNVLEGIVTPMP